MSAAATFEEHATVMREAATRLPDVLAEVVRLIGASVDAGHKVLACGNGGSAAAAQHLVAELVCRFERDRAAIAAVAITSDVATLTAIGNDYGYSRVFARQIEAIALPGDVLAAFSTSGNSANVVAAAKAALDLGCVVVALTGAEGGDLAAYSTVAVRAPSRVVARIQEVHDVCIHAIAEGLENRLAGGRR
jgi:D-sedoheptulose 7-phosphate isomerase